MLLPSDTAKPFPPAFSLYAKLHQLTLAVALGKKANMHISKTFKVFL